MKTSFKNNWWVAMIFAAALPFVLFSCEKSTSTSTMKAYLTDAPGDFDAVNIDVAEVRVNTDEKGWVTLSGINTGVYNLLEFNNGMGVLIADGSLPSGHISQMRLVLGSNNSVIIEGLTYPLATPSDEQSGLKFNIDENLTAGVNYDVWIDFDAGRSIVLTGNGTYILKPVVRAYTAANSGAISGSVSPLSIHPYITAVNTKGDTLTTYAEASGYFLIAGAPEGTYKLTITAKGYQTFTIQNVSVKIGEVTQLGAVVMIRLI